MSRRAPGRSALMLFFVWTIVPVLIRMLFRLLYRVRLIGSERVPKTGPVIYASNHQSNFDPVLVGLLICDRPFATFARASLFRFLPFALLIRLVGAMPLERGRGDSAAFRLALGELNAGRCMMMFPEGTRTRDGALGEFKPGVTLLQKRTKAAILPLAIEGAHDIWPHGQSRPRLTGRIAVMAGEPITYEQFQREGAEAVLRKLKREIEGMRMMLREDLRRRSGGNYPAPSRGERPFWEMETAGR
ncbi:MAG: 1-acyl-sn-glycerol-3-phosphate acyltransferase [Phycisphaerales bacterium]|nr:MAG: 1-acyl-sn-glycerol-3-phosphate acyltransferase [Phycisphaerales bacterium]